MKMKKYLVCLMAAMMMASLAACGGNTEGGSSSPPAPAADNSPAADSSSEAEPETETETEAEDADSEADDDSAVEVTAAADADIEFEDAVVAQDGQAYLAFTDSQVFVQYWGEEGANNQLAYNAGVVDITGNGTYTVSLDGDTNGFRYDTTGDPNGEYAPIGMGFCAVIIKNGEELLPDAIITIDKITVDGKEVEMTAKNYTSTEDGHIRSNINNPYIDVPSGDARSTEGYLYDEDGNPVVDDADEYSPKIIDVDSIGEWKKLEVTFTISGLANDAAPADDADADADSADDTDADSADDATADSADDADADSADDADADSADDADADSADDAAADSAAE